MKKSHVYHEDQPYLALPQPTTPPSSNSLLPCPPTSPNVNRQRFKLTTKTTSSLKASALEALSLPFAWLSPRLSKLSNSSAVWVAMYFTLNLGLTLYNKYVLNHFPFPYTLTALHALCGTVGTFLMLNLRLTNEAPLPPLRKREIVVLLMFSLLYTINILVSNASLKLVTVPFHQVVRGSAPLFTIGLSAVIFKKGCSRMKLLSLLPVIVGVGFATYGDYYYTLFGFVLTLLGTLLAALKTIVTNLLLRKPSSPSTTTSEKPLTHPKFSTAHTKHPSIFTFLKESESQHRITTAKSIFTLPKLTLSPMQLLYIMSPLAFIQTSIMAHYTGELDRVNRHLNLNTNSGMGVGGLVASPNFWLILNGVVAFALNVVSFNSNKRIGPLGMSVAANVKQVLTVLIAVGMFNLTITLMNGIGIALTLFGGAWYAYIEVQEKEAARRDG